MLWTFRHFGLHYAVKTSMSTPCRTTAMTLRFRSCTDGHYYPRSYLQLAGGTSTLVSNETARFLPEPETNESAPSSFLTYSNMQVARAVLDSFLRKCVLNLAGHGCSKEAHKLAKLTSN